MYSGGKPPIRPPARKRIVLVKRITVKKQKTKPAPRKPAVSRQPSTSTPKRDSYRASFAGEIALGTGINGVKLNLLRTGENRITQNWAVAFGVTGYISLEKELSVGLGAFGWFTRLNMLNVGGKPYLLDTRTAGTVGAVDGRLLVSYAPFRFPLVFEAGAGLGALFVSKAYGYRSITIPTGNAHLALKYYHHLKQQPKTHVFIGLQVQGFIDLSKQLNIGPKNKEEGGREMLRGAGGQVLILGGVSFAWVR